MSFKRILRRRMARRTKRVRASLTISKGIPRVSVFRSLNHIYAQIIDDTLHRTLISFSSHGVVDAVDKKTMAAEVGKVLAQKARASGITKVVFDRGRFLYHGRVKALADALRDGGLIF